MTLLDVNVLLALGWPNHLHHAAARSWFRRAHKSGWATCPLTQNSFVRLSANPRVFRDALSVSEAFVLLGRMVGFAHHRFLADDLSLDQTPWLTRDRVRSHGQVTDAHLLALARRHGARLATFDRGISELLPERAVAGESVLLVPTSV